MFRGKVVKARRSARAASIASVVAVRPHYSMSRCSLLTLRAPLSRSPWIRGPLLRPGRSFAFAPRLAKDREVEASLAKDHEGKVEGAQKESKESPKKEGHKSEGDGVGKKKKKTKLEKDEKEVGHQSTKKSKKNETKDGDESSKHRSEGGDKGAQEVGSDAKSPKRRTRRRRASTPKESIKPRYVPTKNRGTPDDGDLKNFVARRIAKTLQDAEAIQQSAKETRKEEDPGASKKKKERWPQGKSLKEALAEPLDIKLLNPEDLDFQPVDHDIPPVPRLSYGLDRVLFNPGVYRLQDPRSRVYNFDPYLEKIMSVDEFDFSALSEYKTSSKDEELLALTQRMGTKFTGSTSSMSGVLQHFHFLLSNFRPLNHRMLSKEFKDPNAKFSKITEGPSAVFLRWKDGIYAIDADKAYDLPNIMSWLGHSLEKLLTTEREEFERYRRSSPQPSPGEDQSARCYHYSKLGNFLMRSQLDAHDPRLPGTGIFDLKTRAVVSIRMNHQEYESGTGYQIRYDRGEWESYEREFYDMTRATMLKYSLQVRMGRMDGIFVAYHNVERIFGFQYLPLSDMDNVLHGQKDTILGDQEFKLSIRLLDELMQEATKKFPEKTLHMHFHTHRSSRGNPPFMYIFAEPVTEERADEIQNKNIEAHRAFERDIVGISKEDPALQAEWHEIQDKVDEEVEEIEGEAEEAKKVDSEEQSDEKPSEEVEGSSQESEEPSEEVEGSSQESAEPPPPTGPLMGWTLAVRHRLNGTYVTRPESLEPGDSWTIEYHIRELNEDDRWKLYEAVKKNRSELVGEERDSPNRKLRLEQYLRVIKKYSDKGRRWREEQDALAAQTEQKVYEPLGPGSQAQIQSSG